jgi:hypothetical protein
MLPVSSGLNGATAIDQSPLDAAQRFHRRQRIPPGLKPGIAQLLRDFRTEVETVKGTKI